MEAVTRWQDASHLKRWLIAVRAPVLLLTLQTMGIAGLIGAAHAQFDLAIWVLCTVTLMFAHATNNLLNDYVDYYRSVDSDGYFRRQYGPHPLADGLISHRAFLIYLGCTGAFAMCGACLIYLLGGNAVLLPATAGALLLLFYTWPLKSKGLGEASVYLAWGPLMFVGISAASTGDLVAALSGPLFWASLVYGLGPTLVIMGKHIDKLAEDAGQVGTLPVRLGEARSRQLLIAMIAALYLGSLALIGLGLMPLTIALCFASAPQAIRLTRMLRRPRPDHCPADYPESRWPLWFVIEAFSLNTSFSAWTLLGLGLALVL